MSTTGEKTLFMGYSVDMRLESADEAAIEQRVRAV
jgi:hypothetical protein